MKKITDLSISFIFLFILFIPFLIIGIIIKLESKGPIFYISKRVGQNKKLFNMIKFRTMLVNTPQVNTNDLHEANKDKSIFGSESNIFNPDRVVSKNQFLWGLTFGIGLHMCFGRDLDGGVIPDEKTDPNNHQYGIVALLVQKILDENGYPDDKNKPKADLNTERSNWASYPIIFGEKK